MLKFIERYRLDKDEIKALPKSVKQINKLLESEYLGNPYKIIKGDKRGRYFAVDKYHLDEFDNSTLYTCPGLDSACSTIYSLICKEYPEVKRINFAAQNAIAARFGKKYQKLMSEVLEILFEVEPLFDINCDLVPSTEEDDMFAVIIHDGGAIYDELSYSSPRHTESFLYKYLSKWFYIHETSSFKTSLEFKEDIVSPQQQWNYRNREVVREASAKYQKENPTISFVVNNENRAFLEQERQAGETNSALLNRLLSKILKSHDQ